LRELRLKRISQGKRAPHIEHAPVCGELSV
jgi:hypothetical protein